MPIYVLDDDAAMCRTLMRMIGRGEEDEVRCFNEPGALLAVLDELPSGVVLLDINLRGSSGIDLLAEIGARRPTLPVIMVSGTTAVDDAIAAFRGGATHFLRKPFRRDALDSALAEAKQIGVARSERLALTHQAAAIRLSKREYQVLAGLTDGLQSKVIAHRMGISTRTVDMHRGNIFTKLSARNATQAVAIARQLSLMDRVCAV